jgi:hypothetical protein
MTMRTLEGEMPDQSVFARASFKVQFRTTLPTHSAERSERQHEYAALLNQVRTALRDGIAHSHTQGWEVVLIEDSS